MIVRFEPWGAWVKLETTPAVVALDREGVLALGLDGGERWAGDPVRAAPSAPIEVHLAVTARCGAGCEGCYLDARPDGAEPSRASLQASLDAMREAGVFTVAFGGGEPTTRGGRCSPPRRSGSCSSTRNRVDPAACSRTATSCFAA